MCFKHTVTFTKEKSINDHFQSTVNFRLSGPLGAQVPDKRRVTIISIKIWYMGNRTKRRKGNFDILWVE